MRTNVLLIGLAAALTACNSYNPDLGQGPFRCGQDEPRCPRDYTCVTYSADEEICENLSLAGQDGGGGDGGNVDCDTDTLEPNDSLDAPTNTFIPDTQDDYRLVGLAICPDTDQDYFMFQVDIAGRNLRADLEYMSSGGQLILEVLNAAGTVIVSGAAVPGMPDLVRAEVANMPQGTYFVLVRAPAGIQNNYTIDILLSGV